MANPRFEARSRVIYTSMSAGARLLYIALDDMARERGSWFIKQSELATKLGCSERTLRRLIAEVEAHGDIDAKTTGTSTLFSLAWASGRPSVAYLPEARPATSGLPDRPPVAYQGAAHPITVLTGTPKDGRATVRCGCGAYLRELPEEGVRCRMCGHGHYPGCQTCVQPDPVEDATAMLASYVLRCGLSWGEPDVDIAVRSLEAAGGLEELYYGLRWLFLERRAQPGKSYGWFPVALANLSRKTGTR